MRDVVRCVWVRSDAAPRDVAPDGCPELVIDFGAQPRMVFAGQRTRPAMRPAVALGVRFEPDGARGFIGRALSALTDVRLDLAADCGGGCAQGRRAAIVLKDIVSLEDWGARIDAAQHYIAAVMATNGVAIDHDLRAMVRHLESGAHLGDCALSSRQMQRRFADRVGVPAQTLGAIFRFRRVFDEIARGDPRAVAAALDAGAFDRPQTARDFRRFLGCTAGEWARRKLGVEAVRRRVRAEERPHAG